MYTFKLIDNSNIPECVDLLSSVFPDTKKFTNEFIEWEYEKNPNGAIVGFNAYADDVLAAHYVTQPMVAFINGKKAKGLLSLNTAVHPEHRGKKLFTKLAELTYDYAAKNGYEFVYGAANANSTHGFIKRLGFQLVSPLTTKIGFGQISYRPTAINYDFERVWTQEDLIWRLNNPSLKYYINKNQIIVPTGKIGLNALMGILKDGVLNKVDQYDQFKGLKLFKLYVGIDHSIDWKGSFYFDVPKRFKSSPLNLIFRDLTHEGTTLDPQKVKFEIIDFDGY